MKLYFGGGERVLPILHEFGIKNIAISTRYMNRIELEDLHLFDSIIVEGGADPLQKKRGQLYAQYKAKKLSKDNFISRQATLDEQAEKASKQTEKYYEAIKDFPGVILGEFAYGSLTERKGRLLNWKSRYPSIEPVLHPNDYKELLQFSKGFAILGRMPYSVGSYIARVTPMLNYLRPRWIHTLGVGRTQLLERYRWDSTSTVSWVDGTRFGKTYFFDGHTLRQYARKDKSQRVRFKNECEKWGIDYEAFIEEDHEAITRWSISQWKQYGEMLERKGVQAQILRG